MKKNWVLTQEAFDAFLNWLSPDRAEAAQKYEKVRRNLIVLFDYRGCENSDLLADEVINRVTERLVKSDEINQIHSLQFIYGVARHVYLEQLSKRKLISIEDENTLIKEESTVEIDADDCMKTCLLELNENDRRLIIQYYSVEKESKFKEREKISIQYRISVNNLRVKIKRIREKLQDCRKKCLKKNNL